MKRAQRFFLSFAYIIIFLGITAVVHAQETPGLNLTVSPASFDITAKPGEKTQHRFRIRNNLTVPLSLHVHTDILAVDDKGQVVPIVAQPSDIFLNWLQVDQATVSATPREWTDLSYTLSVPPDAAYGYYYALHITQDASGIATSTTKVLGDVVIPVLVNVEKAGETREGRVTHFQATHFVNEFLPVSFDVQVKNLGNTHLKPHGNIFIRGTGDKDLAVLDVNSAGGAILPTTSRTFQSSWSEGFFVLEKGHLVINWDKLTQFRIGKYTANLLLVYDGGSRDVLLEEKTTFWVFPYRLIGGVVVGITLIVLVLRFMLKTYIRHELKKNR